MYEFDFVTCKKIWPEKQFNHWSDLDREHKNHFWKKFRVECESNALSFYERLDAGNRKRMFLASVRICDTNDLNFSHFDDQMQNIIYWLYSIDEENFKLMWPEKQGSFFWQKFESECNNFFLHFYLKLNSKDRKKLFISITNYKNSLHQMKENGQSSILFS